MEGKTKMNLVRNEHGFTLIELIMVIVILGLLAAVAIPKYVDLKSDAGQAAADGVAAALGSASAINKAVYPLAKNLPVVSCTDVATVLEGGVPTGYSIVSGISLANGATADCDVGDGAYTSTFLGHGAT